MSREPGQPQTDDDIRICLQPKHRELEAECGRLRERLADTETEKIERGTEILRLREQLDAARIAMQNAQGVAINGPPDEALARCDRIDELLTAALGVEQ